MAAKTSTPKATRVWPPHTFVPATDGRPDWRGQVNECEVCRLPKPNAVHRAVADGPADLPETPAEDVSDRIVGEHDYEDVWGAIADEQEVGGL